jgi:hypothetical protein
MRIRPVGAELFHEDRRTDMTKPIVALCIFTKPPKNIFSYILTGKFYVNLTQIKINT